MKCENCGHELIGGQIICRACNHNNAMQRVSNWRTRRTGELAGESAQPALARPTPPVAAEQSPVRRTIEPRTEREATLIKFPASSNQTTRQPQPQSTSKPEPAQAADESNLPAWRAQLKEKVRQAREKKSGSLTLPTEEPDEADLDPNPIVEAALKRIRWSSQNPAPTAPPRPARPSRGSAALAEEFTPELDPHNDPEPRVARATTPRLTRPEPRRAEPQPASRRDEMTGRQPISRQPAVSRTETKTLTPRPNGESGVAATAKPEIKRQPPAPPLTPAKILSPLSKADQPRPQARPQATQAKAAAPLVENYPAEEPASEPGYKYDNHPLLAIKVKDSGKRVATQIIEVPPTVSEMPEVSGRTATLWARTLAGACDFEIISVAYLPVFAAYATLNTSLGAEAFFILTVLLAAITFVYQAITLSIGGRTFGMALLNLHLVNTADPEESVSRRRLLLRAWAATIAFLCLPINLVLMRLNRRHLSFPDLISGTSPVEHS